jgi:DHA1 family bicyclomycin/chloramphenicol resistance-like MFS transporter
MARVMSLSSMIFMAAPVIAPAMGQAVVAFATWRWIFIILGLVGAALWIWVSARLVESLAPERRRMLEISVIRESVLLVARDRQSLGYSIAMTSLSCGLMGFILSVSQVFDTIFGRLDLLVTCFLAMAIVMAACSLTNAKLVMRYGMRLIGHSAMIGFLLFAGLHALVAWWGYDSLIVFVIIQSLMMGSFSFAVGNFGAMAMEHMGEAAGMASSLQGSFSTIIGALVGSLIGQAFNGTTIPLYSGILVCGLIAAVAVIVTEKGQLFVARNAPVPQKD